MPKSPNVAPKHILYRGGLTVVDAGPFVTYNDGINMGTKRFLNVAVRSTASNPTVDVYHWVPDGGVDARNFPTGSFELRVPAETFAGPSPSYTFTVPAYGEVVFLAVSANAAPSTDIYVTSYDIEGTYS